MKSSAQALEKTARLRIAEYTDVLEMLRECLDESQDRLLDCYWLISHRLKMEMRLLSEEKT